jgi:ankyrin repeat/BTB/POZ domain-containing protein 1
LTAGSESWQLHKFILSARSPYFLKKLSLAPETTSWRLASTIPPEAFHVALRFLYLGDVPSDLGIGARSFVTEEEVLKGIDKISKQLEIESLWEGILGGNDRRIARQRHQDEVLRGQAQLEAWHRDNVLRHKIELESSRAKDVKWSRDNSIFADVLLCADEDLIDEELAETPEVSQTGLDGIPVGPKDESSVASAPLKPRRSVIFPAHRAMLTRSEYFFTMFSSSFQEAQITEYLQVIRVDCSPEVLEVILKFL